MPRPPWPPLLPLPCPLSQPVCRAALCRNKIPSRRNRRTLPKLRATTSSQGFTCGKSWSMRAKRAGPLIIRMAHFRWRCQGRSCGFGAPSMCFSGAGRIRWWSLPRLLPFRLREAHAMVFPERVLMASIRRDQALRYALCALSAKHAHVAVEGRAPSERKGRCE